MLNILKDFEKTSEYSFQKSNIEIIYFKETGTCSIADLTSESRKIYQGEILSDDELMKLIKKYEVLYN